MAETKTVLINDGGAPARIMNFIAAEAISAGECLKIDSNGKAALAISRASLGVDSVRSPCPRAEMRRIHACTCGRAESSSWSPAISCAHQIRAQIAKSAMLTPFPRINPRPVPRVSSRNTRLSCNCSRLCGASRRNCSGGGGVRPRIDARSP